jgi:diguanylate cyclase (GGDEF)-like protein
VSQPIGFDLIAEDALRADRAQRGSIYAAKIRKLARIDVAESEAETLWQAVARHRRALFNRLGRDVGQRVALLDYVVNIQTAVTSELHLIPKSDLESIEHQAVTDSLTGLQNRHHFDLELERETQRSRRSGLPASLLLLDLDGFKGINDRYGHGVGDEVLRIIGSLILQHVRIADVACRYGGDEFGVILPDTSLETAFAVSQRMCTEINNWFHQTPVLGNYLEVTATGGLALLGDDDSAASLLRNADSALYEAKRAGGAHIRPSRQSDPSGRLSTAQ